MVQLFAIIGSGSGYDEAKDPKQKGKVRQTERERKIERRSTKYWMKEKVKE